VNAAHASPDLRPAYQSAAEELADQLWRLQLLLARAVTRFRDQCAPEHRRGFAGVAILDEEIDTLLGATPHWSSDCESSDLTEARARCEMRAQSSIDAGLEFPLEAIRGRFGLGPLEFDALLLCLAAELHPSYRRVFAYLHNDVTRAYPSIALLLDILSDDWSQRLNTRRALSRHSPLFRYSLLVARATPDEWNAEIAADPGLVAFVLDEAPLHEPRRNEETLALDELLVSPQEREALDRLTRALVRDTFGSPKKTIVVISGSPSSGRRTIARAVCREAGLRLRVRDERRPAGDGHDLAGHFRDAQLLGEVPAIVLGGEDGAQQLPAFIRAIGGLSAQVAFAIVDSDTAPRTGGSGDIRVHTLHLGTPPASVRRLGWQRALRDHALRANNETVQTLASVYPFSVGRIYASVRDAQIHLDDRLPENGAVELPELAAAARNQTSHHLDSLAQSLPLRYGWDDIVLPPDERARLREIADAVRNRERVLEQWGFGDKTSAGPGVNAIFFGPSGTGKTMAATILGAELGMAVYRVDLSRVVSKYIGETERNLDALFDEARRSFALLFFDEAEALFGKRSEVKDAHDRYANIEVAYLLQRMESFEGVAILATNLRKHMDNAFLRRLQFAVEFPLPGVEQRLQIWLNVWPAAAELAEDLDLEHMARRFEFAGGHIRNVAMTAAYLACEDDAPIGMAHVLAATKREFQKLGRGARVDD